MPLHYSTHNNAAEHNAHNSADLILENEIIDDSEKEIIEKPKPIDTQELILEEIIEEPKPNESQELILEEEIIENDPMDGLYTGITEESIDTGVVYKITNKRTGKFYIGKTISYRKDKTRKGADGRFTEHLAKARTQSNKKINFDCPRFYPVLLESLRTDWIIETLLICPLKEMKKYETLAVKQHRSYLPEIGLNFLIADNKPNDGINATIYVDRKVKANRDRAQDGKLKKSNDGLPPNIYNKHSSLKQKNGSISICDGYRVRIVIDDKIYDKSFMSTKCTMEQRLEMAKAWLAELKKQHGLE